MSPDLPVPAATVPGGRGCRGICRLCNNLAALLCLAALLVAPAAAQAARVDPASAVSSPPQLLLIHGGSFLYEDPGFESLTAGPATAAGFSLHYLSYPLGDLPGAVLAARAAAAELRRVYGPDVYAYGSSAGGTLAAILAGEGLVAGAVAKAPPTDLLGWEWPLSTFGPEYYGRIGADPAARRRLSPLRRPAQRPLLVVQGRRDAVVPVAMNAAYAERFRRVHLWTVPGGHWTDRLRPWVLERAFGWLAARASPDPL